MQKINFSIQINAPREKVFSTMLNRETYKQWTKPFNETSDFQGDWSEGSKILFGSYENGKLDSGMVSRVEKNIPNEYISIQHLGMLKDGVEDTTSEEVKKWTPAFENYTFTEKDGGTELLIDIDTPDEYKTEFEGMWPKSLQILKDLCEK